jgi:hypothetical protein
MAKSKSLNLMLNAIDEDDNRYGEWCTQMKPPSM